MGIVKLETFLISNFNSQDRAHEPEDKEKVESGKWKEETVE
jgi:hypothetical protein